jgi:predicted O-methyltransferase YrrM
MPLVVGAVTALVFVGLGTRYPSLALLLMLLSVPAIVAFTQRRSVRFGYCMAAILLAGITFGDSSKPTLYATRTFFGVHRVRELYEHRYHALVHGNIVHGMQSLDPERRHEALTYFHETGPFGQAFKALPAARNAREVGVIGLGAGTLATYAQPQQHWTFFEIDPAVERIARTSEYFSYMESCGDRCRVVIGDARQSLARTPNGAYDLLVLDAFSSDSIPMHLLTREALSLYLSRLAPGGVLVMHVSNRHLRLAPVLARLAASYNLVAMEQKESGGEPWPEAKQPSHWVVMARSRADLGALNDDKRWSTLVPSPSIPLWTDDFSNILSVLDLH